ncbi:MAG: hypothetical protein V9H69_04165 [Anaerolineae bacterium]
MWTCTLASTWSSPSRTARWCSAWRRAPGADLSAVQLRVEGAEAVAVAGAVAAPEHGRPRLRTRPCFRLRERWVRPTVQPRGAGTFDVSMPFAAPSADIHPHSATPDCPGRQPR